MKKLVDFVFNGMANAEDWYVVDIESSIKCPSGFKGDPLYPDNKAVLVGWTVNGRHYQTSKRAFIEHVLTGTKPIAIVGHNLKHDLHLLFQPESYLTPAQTAKFKELVVAVWDTMIVEYILSGHVRKFISLENLAAVYGVAFKKDTTVKDLWDSGTDTEDIPRPLLTTYLKEDVRATDEIFLQQSGIVSTLSSKVTKLINVQMYTLLMVQEMEQVGMYVDVSLIQERVTKLEAKLAAYALVIETSVAKLTGLSPLELSTYGINLTAPRTLSTVFFGLPGVPYKKKELVGKYKNGRDKYKLMPYVLTPRAHVILGSAFTSGKFNPKLGWTVDEPCLVNIATNPLPSGQDALAKALLSSRRITKELSTYYKPFLKQVATYREARIHPTIHQCSTNTGRQSSSNPNGQNIPPSVKEVVQGDLFEADYKQLEVCGLAQLSGDPTLIQDLKDGVDIHSKIGAEAGYTIPMSKEERKDVKGIVFGTIYGGGPVGLAKGRPVTSATVKNIQKAFFDRYPTLKDHYERVTTEVHMTSFPSDKIVAGQTALRGAYTLPTGRKITFFEEEDPFHKGVLKYSPPKIKNRPVQGLATADMVPLYMALLLVFKRWFDSEDYLLDVDFLMPVHDSILAERQGNLFSDPVSNRHIEIAFKYIGEQVVPFAYEQWTGTPLVVPLLIDLEHKHNWRK